MTSRTIFKIKPFNAEWESDTKQVWVELVRAGVPVEGSNKMLRVKSGFKNITGQRFGRLLVTVPVHGLKCPHIGDQHE